MEKKSTEIRWRQRLETYHKALNRLKEVIDLKQSRPLSALEKDGMVQRFEYTQELAWKVLKNYIEYQGGERLVGSRDTIRQAFSMGLILNPDPWFDMLESRNETVEVYDEGIEDELINKIILNYFPILKDLYSHIS
ncbi:MAG: nucleotidyltransferase substrate binding protein [Prevotellaceae bacterium]|nr:nucleotidyltransferase substrate binding protein [Prevotellaceae bacterium]